MTPQEHELVNALFDRLASLEGTPRDPEAEQVIAEGLRRAPHAVYALVQTVLVQDEALRRANSRIEELEAAGKAQPRAGFLDAMREAMFGRSEARGSVPSVRPREQRASGVWNAGPGAAATRQPMGAPLEVPPAGSASATPGGGASSFLGTAAATAAGVIGGALLLDSIRSMFSSHTGGQSLFDASGESNRTPGESGAAGGDLAREAGWNDIGGAPGAPRESSARHANLFADEEDIADDVAAADEDYDDGDFGADDFDTA